MRDRPTCRLHGSKGGAPRGERNGAWRHGMRSGEVLVERAMSRLLLRLARAELKDL
jgi:hypothetical protein